jgi:PAS domain S-box-containing protein
VTFSDIPQVLIELNMLCYFVNGGTMITTAITFSSFENVKNFLHAEDAEKKIRDLLHAIDESSIVAFTDLSGRINYVNDKFCEISGYSREELIGNNHRLVNSGYHSRAFYSDLWQTIKSGQVWKGEIKNKAKDGSFYWVFTTIIPILNERNRPREYLSIRYDITEKKRLEEEHARIEQEILEAKINRDASERFVSSLTHDLRTPLTAIKLSVQLMDKTGTDKEFSKKLILKILQNINRADDMVCDLLNANKIRAGHKLLVHRQDCDAKDIAQKTIDELSMIYGPRFELNISGDCLGRWSQSGIKRIIENLSTNAIKYGDEKRKVTIFLQSDESKLEIKVHNWGHPLKSEETSNLFGYLQRASKAQNSNIPGWGIGLTIVKGIAEGHDGGVKVESAEKTGTVFSAWLPKQKSS